MKGKYKGPMSVDQFFQALYQDREFFERFAITHIRGATLYFTPCDERGEEVQVYHSTGEEVDGFISAGPYHCAADFYDAQSLEPEITTAPARPLVNVPLSPI